MTAKFRADVASEASTVVTVARRVFEQTSSVTSRPGPLSDDVMVWIGQIVHQDVNLFEGPSCWRRRQRDLYASGLLPSRTPRAGVSRDRAQPAAQLRRRGVSGPSGPMWSRRRRCLWPDETSAERAARVPPARNRARDRRTEPRGARGAVFVVLFAAGLGASVATRVSDPSSACRRRHAESPGASSTSRFQAGRRTSSAASSTSSTTWPANSASTRRKRRERTSSSLGGNARQVAHDIKNPLTAHSAGRRTSRARACGSRPPLGGVLEQCVSTIFVRCGCSVRSPASSRRSQAAQCPVRRRRCRRAAR